MQIQILRGIYRKTTPDLASAYPVNMMPVAEETGISKGYLRSARGIRKTATTREDRGGYEWNGTHYRVIGTKLVSIVDGAISVTFGDVGSGGAVRFAQSFDRLAINSGSRLYYLRNNALARVTDPDLGDVDSVIWIDGYFMTTDGSALVVTELNDPFSVDPLKYGSSEADPDPVIGLLALRGEVVALNRYSIEFFSNAGTTGFPFVRQSGAQIPRGCVGPQAYAPFVETFAFVGSGRNEQPAVCLAGAGRADAISPKELDEELSGLSAEDLSTIEVESVNYGGIRELLVHLPSKTWVFSYTATQILETPVWYILAGGELGERPYPGRHHVYSDGRWWCGGPEGIGYLDDSITSQYGAEVGFEFVTPLIYNEGRGAMVHELELVAISGTTTVGQPGPDMFLSWTDDGLNYTQERALSLGGSGDRDVRMAWRRCGRMRNWRSFRFRGVSRAPRSFPRLEAQVEALGG